MTKYKERIAVGFLLFGLLILKVNSQTVQTKLDQACQLDEECSPPYITCRSGKCKHKTFFPLETREIIGGIILLILSLLASIAGIGGGSFIVPIMLLFFDFSTKESVAFSNGLIFFSATVKVLIGFTRKHPLVKHRTLINYKLVMILIPSMLFGSFIGSSVSTTVPDVIQIGGLILVTSYATYRTYKKAIQLWKSENEQKNKLKKSKEPAQKKKNEEKNLDEKKNEDNKLKQNQVKWDHPSMNESALVHHRPFNSERIHVTHLENFEKIKGNTLTPVSELKSEEEVVELKEVKENKEVNVKEEVSYTEEELKIHKQLRRIESTNFHWKKMMVIISVIVIAIIVIFLRGGKGMKSIIGISKCDSLDWVIMGIYLILVLIITLFANKIVLKEQALKVKYRFIDPGENKILIYDLKFIIKINFFTSIIGFIASIVGIGGAMLISPLLLSLDGIPEVVSFTGMYPTAVDKLIVSLVFFISGLIPLDYVLIIGGLVAVLNVLGEIQVSKLVKKTGRQSIISFIFIGILSIAMIMSVIVGYRNMKAKHDEGVSLLAFKSICS